MRKLFKLPLIIFISIFAFLFVMLIIGLIINPQSDASLKTTAETMDESEPMVKPIVEIVEAQESAQNVSMGNLLMTQKIIEVPVTGGAKQRIGTRAYINVSRKTLLEDVSFEDVSEFYKAFKNKNYLWVSILCPDETGLVFTGNGIIATYGKVDKAGRIAEKGHWSLIYDENTETFKELKIAP